MEPQLEGCGKLVVERVGAEQGLASMEPQLEGCGKADLLATSLKMPPLQWSRNLRVAERRMRCRYLGGIDKLQWSRNLRVAERAALTGKTPSEDLLQWSRNLRVAESGRVQGQGRRTPSFNGAAT